MEQWIFGNVAYRYYNFHCCVRRVYAFWFIVCMVWYYCSLIPGTDSYEVIQERLRLKLTVFAQDVAASWVEKQMKELLDYFRNIAVISKIFSNASFLHLFTRLITASPGVWSSYKSVHIWHSILIECPKMKFRWLASSTYTTKLHIQGRPFISTDLT